MSLFVDGNDAPRPGVGQVDGFVGATGNAHGLAEGTPVIAIDPLGAGMHQKVIISSDGSAARLAVMDDKSPVRQIIIAIIDEPEKEAAA